MTAVVRTRGGLSVRWRVRPLIVGTACTLVALAAAVLAIGSGDYPMSPVQVLRTLAGGGTPADAFILAELRLPRTVTALLAGGALGLSGAVLQSVAGNPLASPDVLGVGYGAAGGALTMIIVFGGGGFAVAAGAAGGGLVTAAVIYALAWRSGVHGYRLILVGIGMSAILTGLNGYLLTRAQISDAARAVLWMTGSLDGRGWAEAMAPLAVMVLVAPVVLGHGRALRVLELGDDAAGALGVRAERVRLIMLGGAVLLAAVTSAATGPVAFVALTAPQLARRLTRVAGPNLLPSLCMGMALLVSADLAGQRLIEGRQLPVGVMTGLLGGAYLVWLLTAERRAGRL